MASFLEPTVKFARTNGFFSVLKGHAGAVGQEQLLLRVRKGAMLLQIAGLLLLHLQALGMHIGAVHGGGLADGHVHQALAVLHGEEPQADH